MHQAIQDVRRALLAIDLEGVPAEARETEVGAVLKAGLGRWRSIPAAAVPGIDGSTRSPDLVLLLPSSTGEPPRRLAIELKLYRDRKQGAGELDRGLGQCVAYAADFDAVLLFAVYMGVPREGLPAQWLDEAPLLRVGPERSTPIYLAARPRSWGDPWAAGFGSVPPQAPAALVRSPHATP